MELNVSFTHLLKDEPPGYRPATFGPDLRAAADLYSTGETDALLDTKANLVAVNAQFDAVNTELLAKAPIASPVFTGVPQAPTPATSAVDAQLATTAFVNSRINFIYTANDVLAKLLTVDGIGSGLDADRLGGQLYSTYAPLASPAFSGNPTAPTQTSADISLRIANTQHVSDKITLWSAVNFTPFEILTKLKTVDGTGSGLDTDFFRGLAPSAFATPADLTAYAPLASPALTGTPTAPTPSAAENSTRIATTAFVQASYAKIASPTFTGTPAAPTASLGTNTTQIATTAFVQAAVANVDDITHTWLAKQNFNAGIAFGSLGASTPQDLSLHVALFGTTMGFSVTTSQLNYVTSSGGDHVFWAGTSERARISSAGALTLATPLAVAQGGTGSTTAAGARTNLGLAAIASSGSASDLTSGTVADARMAAATYTFASVSMVGLTITNSGDALKIVSSSATTDPYISFWKVGAPDVRQGYLQHSDGALTTNGMRLQNDVATGGATAINLANTGGVDSLRFFVGANNYYVWHTGNLTIADLAGVPTARVLTAGNGLTGGGDLTANRTFTLGTPTGITGTSTNSVTATSHTHDITLTATDINGFLGYTPANVSRSIIAGNGMTGGGTLSADRTITMGTPGNITNSTTNSVTTTSHTHALGFTAAEVYTGSDPAETNFPVGHNILASVAGDRNASAAIYVFSGTTQYGNAGTLLAGTWRTRGISGGGGNLWQRVA